MATQPDKRPLVPSEGNEGNARKRRPKPPPSPRQKATVSKLADQVTVATSGAQVDDHILDRIKKCLDRASHPGTTEAEAKAALFLSQKLMGQYNVTNADLISKESADKQVQFSGSSIVTIAKTAEENVSVQNEGFVANAIHAITTFFDCECYSTRTRWSIKWTFYGIAENTVMAAKAFEMVYNLISQWTLAYRGRSARHSYSNGVSRGLLDMACEEKRREREEARKAEAQTLAERVREEERQRVEEIARLNREQSESCVDDNHTSLESAPLGPTASSKLEPTQYGNEDSDDEDDNGLADGFTLEPDFEEEDGLIDSTVDLDEAISRLLKRKESPRLDLGSLKQESKVSVAPPKKEPSPEMNQWKSEMQLVQFRRTAAKVAEEYIQQEKIELVSSTPSYTAVRDGKAYSQGVKDSNRIDVRGRRLE
ncbi:uncharacterized protein GIQ15_05833 [Arthroderma uncinatum]|uniref:uncharacterized protein n=1 Tax=Arthroderma uncinatum TaxID=74035 RepID=UPI00144ADA6E|nr:uncharacterized protein GIQ15_05833 [Arthroderma uncinatum]KAF3480486.1 hypothetical protein GIQ15_05833 [Arthroderma uncinatum]